MEKPDMFQSIFWKVDESVWGDLERIKNDPGTQFTMKDYQEGLYVRGVILIVVAP